MANAVTQVSELEENISRLRRDFILKFVVPSDHGDSISVLECRSGEFT